MEILRETSAIAMHGIGEVVNRFVSKIAAEHGAKPFKLDGDFGSFGSVSQAGFQLLAKLFEALVNVGALEFFQGGNACCHCQRVPTQRAGLIDRSDRREVIHDLRPSAESADRQAATDDFSETRQIRRDVEALLRPARTEPEAGHDFIENEERALGGG